MAKRRTGGWHLAACFTMLALAGLTLPYGCKKTGGERVASRAAQAGDAGAGARAGGAGQTTRRGRRGRPRGGAMRDAFGAASETAATGGARGTGAAAQVAPIAAVVTPPAAMPEAERAKKIRSFAAAYGPLTLSYEKNWDGRVVESVLFTHQNRRIKLPLSMVLDSAKPESLEGYFVVYPAVGSPGKGTVTYKITGSSAVPPAPEQPSTVTKAVAAEPKPAPAAGEPSVAATTAAGAGAQQAGARRAGGRGGRRGGRGMRGG